MTDTCVTTTPLTLQSVTALRKCTREIASRDEVGLASTGENVDRAEQLASIVLDDVRRALASFDPDKPNVSSLFLTVATLMAKAEAFPNVTGLERKAIVMHAIKAALTLVAPEYAVLLMPLVDTVIGPFIDAGVETYHLLGKVSKQAAKSCMAFCFKAANKD